MTEIICYIAAQVVQGAGNCIIISNAIMVLKILTGVWDLPTIWFPVICQKERNAPGNRWNLSQLRASLVVCLPSSPGIIAAVKFCRLRVHKLSSQLQRLKFLFSTVEVNRFLYAQKYEHVFKQTVCFSLCLNVLQTSDRTQNIHVMTFHGNSITKDILKADTVLLLINN